MIPRKLVDYIKYELSKGVSFAKIKQKLLEAGWSEKNIETAKGAIIPKQTTYPEYHEKTKTLSRGVILIALLSTIILGSFAVYFLFFDGAIFLEQFSGFTNKSELEITEDVGMAESEIYVLCDPSEEIKEDEYGNIIFPPQEAWCKIE